MKDKYKNDVVLKIQFKDSDLTLLQDSVKSGKLKSVKVKIEATHSAKVNKNFWFYSPTGMRDGTETFIKPYPKPVTVNHDPAAAPIGRVTDATYIKYDIASDIHDASPVTTGKYVDKVNKWISNSIYKDTTYKGLGHVQLIAEITDQDAISKILDKRYLTVSIGGGSDHAYCSICGTDKKASYCDHYRGEVYDGQTCFYISGTMNFDHISYVASPADDNALSEVMDSATMATLEILDYEIDKGSNNMKLNIQQLKAKLATYALFSDYMKSIGLDQYISDESEKNAKELMFVFADERVLPIFDKAHTAASMKFVQEHLEDSEDKNAIIQLLTDKVEEAFGQGVVLEDAIADLGKKEDKTPIAGLSDLKLELPESEVNKIVDALLEKLKSTFTVSDSFASQRMRALERDNAALSATVSTMEDKYKKGVIGQILQLEDKTSDEEYKLKLLSRNITSLEDKLQDLVDTPAKVEDNDKNKENNGLKPGVTVQDAKTETGDDDTDISDEDKNSEDEGKQPVEEKTLSISEIKDSYKDKVRTEGLKAAKAWFKQLTDEGKVPSNFTFN
jgi:hypothetical protein